MEDEHRKRHPVSGTRIRNDPRGYWDYLRGPVRQSLAKRVVCIGAESCGTTTLARDLARHFCTTWAPEYGRLYTEGRYDPAFDWTSDMLTHIAQVQNDLIDSMARHSSNGLVVCDTDALATHVWDEFLVKEPSDIPAPPADLYILTELCPWEDDGYRWGETFREHMQWSIKHHLTCRHLNWTSVIGNQQTRLEAAVSAVNRLTWDLRVL
jgi:NadR type nicotinamide-nucleotide adenylyltransferase